MRVCEPFELAYAKSQAQRVQEADQQSEEWGFDCLTLAEMVKRWGKAAIVTELARYPDIAPEATATYQLQCAQCVNWRSPRPRRLSNGNIHTSPGFCELRAASDQAQESQTYASQCPFFEEVIPF